MVQIPEIDFRFGRILAVCTFAHCIRFRWMQALVYQFINCNLQHHKQDKKLETHGKSVFHCKVTTVQKIQDPTVVARFSWQGQL